MFRAAVAAIRSRTSPTTFKWVKGHSGVPGNEGAGQLTKEGAEKDLFNKPNLEINPKFNLTGAQLSELTQALTFMKGYVRRAPLNTREVGHGE